MLQLADQETPKSLIDDPTSDLAEELSKNEGLCLDDSFLADDLNDPEELESTWEVVTSSSFFIFQINSKISLFIFRHGCRILLMPIRQN